MTGTESQIGWAEIIKPQVAAEFDRVAKAFHAVARNQDAEGRRETEAVLAILEEKRAEVLANDEAGYFISNWGEMTDQVRQLIAKDSRYMEIKANRAARL